MIPPVALLRRRPTCSWPVTRRPVGRLVPRLAASFAAALAAGACARPGRPSEPAAPRPSPAVPAAVPAAVPVLPPASAAEARPADADAFAGGWEGEAQTTRWPLFFTLRLRPDPGPSTVEVLGQTLTATEVRAAGDSLWVRVGAGAGALVLDAQRTGGRLDGRLVQGRDTLPFALARIPDYPRPAGREAAWAQDLDALATRFLPLDRSFGPEARGRFLAAIADTRARLGALRDDEVVARLAAAVALGGNAHTRLYLVRNAGQLRRLPVRVWWFADGLRVVRATPEYRALLGCRIDAIAGTPARQARALVAPAFAGNASWQDYMSTYSLTSPELLRGFGVVRGGGPADAPVALRLSDCAGPRAARVRPLPLEIRRGAVEAWWDLSPRHASADTAGGRTWVQVLAPLGDRLPLYLQRPHDHYWFTFLPGPGLLYVQVNRAADMPSEPIARFGERLLAELDRRPVRGLVLDLRFNTGGNLTLGEGLMRQLAARTRGLRRWVVTGRATFSAGITHAAQWAEAGGVTFVGEPAGDALDFWAEGGNVRLPNSGIDAHFANGAHRYSPAPCPAGTYCYDLSAPGLGPGVPASARWADYVRGRDPALAAVLAALGRAR